MKTTINSIIEKKGIASFYVLKVRLEDLNRNKEYLKQFKDLDIMAKKLKVIPEVSIAGYAIDGKESIPTDYTERVSVMLPLPRSPATVTGLPVIVNAFFALSENRRVLKWETSDDHSEQVKWNSELFELLVPECYSEFLSKLSSIVPSEKILKYWPKQLEHPEN